MCDADNTQNEAVIQPNTISSSPLYEERNKSISHGQRKIFVSKVRGYTLEPQPEA